MSAATHHEIHPDAEILSAFAEQALDERERGKVLEHLAACGRCRQIVALECEAAGAQVAPARPVVVRPRRWWRSWGFALAPAAVVAATAVVGFYVHERAVERRSDVAKLEQQRADEKPPMPSQATPQPQIAAVPPADPRSAPAKPHKTGRTAAAGRTPVAEPDETAAAPPPEVTSGLHSRREEPVEAPGFERHRSNDEALARTGGAPGGTTPSDSAVDEDEREKHAEEKAEERHQSAANPPMPSNEHSSESDASAGGTPGSSEHADTSAEQLQTQPATTAGYFQLHRMRSMMNVPTGPDAFRLPSGRAAVSIASADHRVLAIDEKGALFLRENSGGTWEKVKRQWTGRAVAVRRHANGIDTAGATPETLGEPSGSGTVSQSDTAFELVNDQSQVWISDDGRIWTTK